MKNDNLQPGQEITINIPFTYTIGEEGYHSGNVLNTIGDCKKEVIAEIEAGVLSEDEPVLTVQEETVPEFIKKIDWKLLREQKESLILLTKKVAMSVGVSKDLDGMIHLIDAIQDYGVDVMGLPEDYIFLLSNEDEL